jgi:hypothetical protein
VADIFYVRDTATGEKIEEDVRIEAISTALKHALLESGTSARSS